MSIASQAGAPVRHADRFFIGGQWTTHVHATIKVIDPGTEELYFRVAEAQVADIERAVSAAREAFDNGPWPRLTHGGGPGTFARSAPRCASGRGRQPDLAARVRRAAPGGHVRCGRGRRQLRLLRRPGRHVPWEEPSRPARGGFGLLVREPVG